jgi:lipoprotein-anchoring transpeptidase ErfK/SrfK
MRPPARLAAAEITLFARVDLRRLRPGHPAALLAGSLVVVAVAGGCGSAGPRSEGSGQTPRAVPTAHPAPVAVPRRCSTNPVVLGSARTAYAAVVPRDATALRAPDGAAPVVARLARLDVNGVPTVLGVIGSRMGADCSPRWYHVQLATMPNGSTAWVAARSLRLYTVESRIVVSLSKRRLVLYRSGRPTLRAPVAVGAPSTPTPTGSFFVNERFVLDNPDGPFGSAALGISAHSDVLKDWVEGGPIALHGTNEPATIGQAVSHGCIRLANRDIMRVLSLAPAGTPVEITS